MQLRTMEKGGLDRPENSEIELATFVFWDSKLRVEVGAAVKEREGEGVGAMVNEESDGELTWEGNIHGFLNNGD